MKAEYWIGGLGFVLMCVVCYLVWEVRGLQVGVNDVMVRSNYIYGELEEVGNVLEVMDSLDRQVVEPAVYNIQRHYYEVLNVNREDVSGDTLVIRINEMLGRR